MSLLPQEFLPLILTLASLFSKPVWESAMVLLVGALLAFGKRTVSSILRVMGLHREPHQNYHRLLSRAVWSTRPASQLLLQQLVNIFAPSGVLVMGIDDTIERGRGKLIKARRIYRDPVRSSDSHFVKTSGLRWLSLILTVLAASQRHDQSRGRRDKTLTDWARQMLTQVRRWLPHRAIVLVANSSFAALELLEALRQLPRPVQVVRRLPWMLPSPGASSQAAGTSPQGRKTAAQPQSANGSPWYTVVVQDWDGHGDDALEVASHTAVWYHTGLLAMPVCWVLLKDPKGKFEPQALLCTVLSAQPSQILRWFRQCWQLEVTLEEVRSHLGVESQRQWSPLSILRTTPALVGLFSIVVVLAHQVQIQHPVDFPNPAGYHKSFASFTEALALVRQQLWQVRLFHLSMGKADMVNVPRVLFNCWSDLLCYAA